MESGGLWIGVPYCFNCVIFILLSLNGTVIEALAGQSNLTGRQHQRSKISSTGVYVPPFCCLATTMRKEIMDVDKDARVRQITSGHEESEPLRRKYSSFAIRSV